MAKRNNTKQDQAPVPEPQPTTAFEISDRVTLQARMKAPGRDPRAPLYRPLRIYTLDPSVSDRLGGVAVVQVPYEKLQRGPIGALFEVMADGAPRELAAELLLGRRPGLFLRHDSSRLRPCLGAQPEQDSFSGAVQRSLADSRIVPDHVQFLTEDAMRWQPPSRELAIPDLAFNQLRFAGEPGQPADAAELDRQARALGRFVTDPAHAESFRLIAPGKLPKGVTYASPAIVQSVRVTRRVAPDGRIAFDLVGEVTQSCTVSRDGMLFDMNGGCTVIIDPEGQVRYSIYKRFDSDKRRERQQAAMRGSLKNFWMKQGANGASVRICSAGSMRRPAIARRQKTDYWNDFEIDALPGSRKW